MGALEPHDTFADVNNRIRGPIIIRIESHTNYSWTGS